MDIKMILLNNSALYALILLYVTRVNNVLFCSVLVHAYQEYL